ncbi:MAG: hypothetical protein LBG22_09720 [Treponema sp.]|nr:hypothetical protein [Treponema sp.]
MAYRTDREAYTKVIEIFRRQRKGATIADISAKSGLSLQKVRELVPRAADEYSARLEVTESGEILYSFPRGFTSKYRGFRAVLGRFLEKSGKLLKIAGTWFFKVWIMVMLVGYFVLFMLIALATLVISVAAASGSNNSRSSRRHSGGGLFFTSSIFDLIIRIWFYSELTKSLDGRHYRRNSREAPKGRPLYKAIFSFVFGEGDPNAGWTEKENQSVIAYIQAHQGVISLPEYMTLTGMAPVEAEEGIIAFCTEFGGSPEVTGDGTIVYRFDELLRRTDTGNRSFPGLSAPVKRLFSFSSNSGKMNGWFALINGVNLGFGGYFLFNALKSGQILTQAHLNAASYLYGVTYLLFSQIVSNPLPFLIIGLGIVPLVFSLCFWLIPSIRFLGMKKRNEKLKLENLRKDGYRRIWDNPLSVTDKDINPQAPECRPRNLSAAREQVIKELGSYAVPDVAIGDAGTVYVFKELDREKAALENYRATVDAGASALGKTVFDSE